MDTKQYLENIRKYDRMVEVRAEELIRLRTQATNISPHYSEDKIQTSFSNDKLTLLVAEIIEKENEIKKILRKKGLAIAQIEGLDNYNEYVVLTDRYVKGLAYKEIAVDIERSERHCIKIHDRAIAHFEEKYGNDIQ